MKNLISDPKFLIKFCERIDNIGEQQHHHLYISQPRSTTTRQNYKFRRCFLILSRLQNNEWRKRGAVEGRKKSSDKTINNEKTKTFPRQTYFGNDTSEEKSFSDKRSKTGKFRLQSRRRRGAEKVFTSEKLLRGQSTTLIRELKLEHLTGHLYVARYQRWKRFNACQWEAKTFFI